MEQHVLMLKINIDPQTIQEINQDDAQRQIHEDFYNPLKSFLDSRDIIIKNKCLGIHSKGKKGKPHIHIHIISDVSNTVIIPNFLANYKYYYNKQYTGKKLNDFFKKYSHSHRKASIIVSDKTVLDTDRYNILSYPYKECLRKTDKWKIPPETLEQLLPYEQEDLVKNGAGQYLAAINKHIKNEKKEEQKLEKWGEFCQYMDELRNTPTGYQMESLRGVCIIALDHMREKSERTSVNAVITMCKDYCFKRNIWTNEQILDKYYII